ncbi:methionine---tRNA ligase [Trachipleistophora hominis]|uniref:methionine--tRNA ligase n=1 Tax=Trachipleistophora hominis TaxID=72359 RepID=L7JSL0_TRAHO|nr:methionine---tRNA ligase [Trachipleistophora hominis]
MSSSRKKVITAALPYVNNSPHLGNIIGSVLSADVYARFCRKSNEKVIFVCGTDDYGTATEITARKDNTTCEEVVKHNRQIMIDVFDWFSIEFDCFGQTSDPEHSKVVQDIFHRIIDRIEEDVMQQYHCSKCEMFLADRYLTGTCSKCKSYGLQGDQCDACGILLKIDEIIDPECAICGERPQIRETRHLFLKLNELADDLRLKYEKNSSRWSKNACEITLQWLEKDLHKRCITRDLKWGVPVPDMNKVFYVWFDAVIGYFSFFKMYVERSENRKFESLKQLEEDFLSYEFVQFMGKDNVPFHTIIMPAILDFIANKLSVTEYLMFENKKFSKSKQIGIFGSDLIHNEYGTCDLWRYYLVKVRPETKDSNFSVTDFLNSTSDLQNNFGNLCNRVLKFIKNKMTGRVCFKGALNSATRQEFVSKINDLLSEYKRVMCHIKMKKGLTVLSEMCMVCNHFLQKTFEHSVDQDAKNDSFALVFSVIALLADLYEPFIPNICADLHEMCEIKPRTIGDELQVLDEHDINQNVRALFVPLGDEILENLRNKAK